LQQRYSAYAAERRVLTDVIARRSGRFVIEIGAYKGATTVHLAAAARTVGKEVYVIDPWPERRRVGERAYQDFLRNTAQFSDIIHVVRESSQTAHLPISLAGDVCLVFIDGDHSCDAAFADMVKYWPLISAGGVMAAHDYYDARHGVAVSAAIERFVSALSPPQNLHTLKVYPTDRELYRHRAKGPTQVGGLAWIVKDDNDEDRNRVPVVRSLDG